MTNTEQQPEANLYYDPHLKTQAAKILPGQYYVTARDLMIVTVLGSCVSACIRDRMTGFGGMNHFMLPEGDDDPSSPHSASARYGSYAMEVLINQLIKSGAKRSNLEAKLFGGGAVLAGITSINVGERNAQFATDYLKREQIKLIGKDLLDIYPRKIYYFPQEGRVLVKRLKDTHNDTVVKRDREYLTQLKTVVQTSGDIDLF